MWMKTNKTLRILMRIIVLPAIFIIVMVPNTIGGLLKIWYFLLYGGEWINYGKDEKRTFQIFTIF